MGWWSQSEEGVSFAEGSELVWGDGPADIIDEALAEIDKEFEDAYGRKPTNVELLAGFKFSIGVREE